MRTKTEVMSQIGIKYIEYTVTIMQNDSKASNSTQLV